ncbi:Trp biosynthesis-associated membrane protein [Actinoplanes sp. NPDC051494]|uniref:Trp biosynthesis-associated membrane protein n=1 Tax=Actinoplanes sp. NPDC051494 TaxID=3363907 RepID=UPI00379EAB21
MPADDPTTPAAALPEKAGPAPAGTAESGPVQAGSGESGPSPAYQLGAAVVLCVLGAGLVWYLASRVWTATLVSGVKTDETGADVAPLVPALALVGLAAGGALLATRGLFRRILGAFVMVAGLAAGVAAVIGWTSVPAGPSSKVTVYMVGCVLGGIVIALGGLWALRLGHRWPAMGARYERGATTAPAVDDDGRVDARAAWDALDRGDDPTNR